MSISNKNGSNTKYLYISTLIAWIITIAVWAWLSIFRPFEGISGLFLIPFILGTFLLTITSIYVGVSKKLVSSSKPIKIIGFSVLAIIPIILGYLIYSSNQPYSKDETLRIIQNCEVYSVTLENENRAVLNYIDKDKDYKTNLADPSYFEDYAKAAESLNSSCNIDVNRR